MSLRLPRAFPSALLLFALTLQAQAQEPAAGGTTSNPTDPGSGASNSDLIPTAAADTSAASSTCPSLNATTSDCDSSFVTVPPAMTTLYRVPYVDYTDYYVVNGTTVETYYETGFSLRTANPYATVTTAGSVPTTSAGLSTVEGTVTRPVTSPTWQHEIESVTATLMLGTVATVTASGTRTPIPVGSEETGVAAGVKASLGDVLMAVVIWVLVAM